MNIQYKKEWLEIGGDYIFDDVCFEGKIYF